MDEYFLLFNRMSDAVDRLQELIALLQSAQRDAEDLYISR